MKIESAYAGMQARFQIILVLYVNSTMNEYQLKMDTMGAKFLLNLKKYRVTQATVDFVLSTVVKFIEIASTKIKYDVLEKLKEFNHDLADILDN